MAKKEVKTLIGLDGIERTPEQEQTLNAVFNALFKAEPGATVLAYLKSITIDTVAGPEIGNEQLRHIEGQRYIIGLIQRRMSKGKSQQKVEESKDG